MNRDRAALSPTDIARARELLAHAVKHDPDGVAGVARRVGRARSGLSMFMRDKYGAQTGHLAAVLLQKLDGWVCPHTALHISPADCRAIALGPAPTHHPTKLTHWRCCQQCPGKPKEDRNA